MLETMRLIDSHCHLHDSEFFTEGQDEIYQRAVQAGIGMICVGTDERSSAEAVAFAESHELAWAAIGVHPHDAKAGWGQIATLMKSGSQKIVAVGEIGLDYYYNHSPREMQIQALEAQIQLALDYKVPISFHVRNAFDDFWPVLDNFHGVRGVLHSFTDTLVNANEGLARGLFIGINGISTFTREQWQRELYRTIPLNNIILETDAPFLTPKPFRGKINEVGYVELVARHQAEQRHLPLEDVCCQTTKNARQLFNI